LSSSLFAYGSPWRIYPGSFCDDCGTGVTAGGGATAGESRKAYVVLSEFIAVTATVAITRTIAKIRNILICMENPLYYY
jgi:hypothetical protein